MKFLMEVDTSILKTTQDKQPDIKGIPLNLCDIPYDFQYTLLKSIEYHKWRGENIEIVFADKRIGYSDLINKLSDFIPVGSVEFVHEYLKVHYNKVPKPINVPLELQKQFPFSQREFINSRLIYPEEHYKYKGWFAKDIDKVKGYAGLVVKDIPQGYYQLSSVLDEIISEWRCFVFQGKLQGIQYYSGDFKQYPSVSIIEYMIEEYKSAPVAYTLDVAVIRPYPKWPETRTAVIECHNFYSCGLYGFNNMEILPYMFSQWFYEFIKEK